MTYNTYRDGFYSDYSIEEYKMGKSCLYTNKIKKISLLVLIYLSTVDKVVKY